MALVLRRIDSRGPQSLWSVVASLLFLCLAASPGFAAPAAPPLRRFGGEIVSRERSEPILKTTRPHVVTVEALNSKGKLVGLGTGFFVNSNQVATCLHVIEAASRLRLVTADGKRQVVHGLFGTDRLMDAAVLWVTNASVMDGHLRLRTTLPEMSERIFVLGGPDRLPFRAARGTVTDLRNGGTEFINSAIEFSAPVMPGFSGGPLLDANGFVIGMTSALGFSANRRTSIASPGSFLQRLCQQPAVTFEAWRVAEPRLDDRFYQSMMKGSALAVQSRPADALKEFEKAIALCGTNAVAWFSKGHCLLNLEQISAAVTAFQTARELAPEIISTRAMFARALQRANRNAEALEEARSLLRDHPDSLVAHSVLITALAGHGDYLRILETAQLAERKVFATAQNRLMQGSLWNIVGCPAAAEVAFRESLQIQPDNGMAWQQLGRLQMDQQNYIEAVTSLTQAFGDPTFHHRSNLRYLVTSVAILNGETGIADKQFQNFLKEERRSPTFQLASPRIQKAFSTLGKRDWRKAATHDFLALFFLETKRPDEFIPALETSGFLNPTNATTWVRLAEGCCRSLRYERAIQTAGKAIELNPSNGEAQFWLGWALCAKGSLASARTAFQRAEQLKATPWRVQMALACLENRTGNQTQADQHLVEAKRLNSKLEARLVEAPEIYIPDFRPFQRAADQWLASRRPATR